MAQAQSRGLMVSRIPERPVVAVVGSRIATPSLPAEAIARRAYAKFEARGRAHGFDLEDWLEAERELLAKVSLE